jgi:integrase
MLSDLKIRGLKAGARDTWVSDGRNGLYIRVRATGGKSWVVRRRLGGKAEVITLGPFRQQTGDRGLSLAEARTEAAAISGRPVSNATLSELLEDWYAARVEQRYRRPKDVRGYIDRFSPALTGTKLRELNRLAVSSALKRYAKDRGPVAANRALSVLKTALAYGVNVGHLDLSPIAGLSPENIGGEEVSRDRVLTDDEVRAVWHTKSSHTPLLRFLLLTGQRIGETQSATWSDIRGDRWHIPAANAKNGRAHWVALSTQALELLREQESSRNFVFGTATDTGVQAWLKRYCKREVIEPAFTPHDLRRTVATRMADLEIAPHVIEKILNHTMQGVMATYNRSEYEKERVAAMQTWADEIQKIVTVQSCS